MELFPLPHSTDGSSAWLMLIKLEHVWRDLETDFFFSQTHHSIKGLAKSHTNLEFSPISAVLPNNLDVLFHCQWLPLLNKVFDSK